MRPLITILILLVTAIPAAHAACPPCALIDKGLPVAVEGTAYTAAIPAVGCTAPVSFLLTEGLLPPGITMDAAGTLQGTPRGPGEYRFTVRGSDRCTPLPQHATQTFVMVVAKPGEPATVSSSRQLPPITLSITPLPAQIEVAATAPLATLRYRLKATPAETVVLESPGMSFVVDGSVEASVPAKLDAVLINGETEITETVMLPISAVRSAKRSNSKIVVNRAFSGRKTSAAAIFQVTLKP